MPESFRRVDVVGAGAWGLSAALALLEAGTKDVHVWEREHPGTGASGRAAGLVSTHLREESDIRLVLETRQKLVALRQWGNEQGLPSARGVYHANGNLTTVRSADRTKLERLTERIQRAGGNSELIEPSAWSRRGWPLMGMTDTVGIYTSEDGYVEPQDLVDLLGARVRALGGTIRNESPVRIRFDGNAATGVETPTGTVDSEHVVLAAGAWSKELLSRSQMPLPLKPYRTQVAQVEYPCDSVPVYHDTELGVYTRPDGPTRMLVGDGTEHVESRPDSFRPGVDTSFVEKIAASVGARWRDGEAAKYRTGWAGLCVATPDRDPIIGTYPGISNLTLMVGDNGFGVMRSIALGGVTRDVILGIATRDRAPYDPKRFSMDADFEIREGFEL